MRCKWVLTSFRGDLRNDYFFSFLFFVLPGIKWHMSIFQLIAVLFALFMVYVVRVKNRRYRLRVFESFGWYFIWITFALLAIFPNILLGVVHTLNFNRVFDLLVVAAFMILTTVLVFMYFKIKELDQKLEKYTREDAMRVKR